MHFKFVTKITINNHSLKKKCYYLRYLLNGDDYKIIPHDPCINEVKHIYASLTPEYESQNEKHKK